MLMPPPDSPNPHSEFDFILKGDQQPIAQPQVSPSPSKLFLPKKAIFAVLGGLVIVIVGLIIISSAGNKSGPADQLVSLMGTGQEIARVSDLIKTKSSDPGTLSLASTTSAAMLSEQQQLSGYMAKAGIKYDPKQLGLYKDAKTDSNIDEATKNNQLDQTYYTYLKTQLGAYQTKIRGLSGTQSKTLKPILVDAYQSTQTLLTAPQLQ